MKEKGIYIWHKGAQIPFNVSTPVGQIAIIEVNAYLEDPRPRGIKSTLIAQPNFCSTQLFCKHLDLFTLPQF